MMASSISSCGLSPVSSDALYQAFVPEFFGFLTGRGFRNTVGIDNQDVACSQLLLRDGTIPFLK